MYYVILDTETTGLDPNKHQILTLGMIMLETLNNSSLTNFNPDDDVKFLRSFNKYEWKLKHENYFVDPKAMEVNKIDLVQHHKEAESTDSAIDQMRRLVYSSFSGAFNNYDPNKKMVSLVGHGVAMDVKMLKATEESAGKTGRHSLSGMFDRRYIDTQSNAMLLQMMGLLPEGVSCSLVDQALWAGCDVSKAHTALGDCELILEVLKKQMKVLRGEGNK